MGRLRLWLSLVLPSAALTTALPLILEETATLTLLHEAAFLKGARCLDGSPGGYYFRPGKNMGSNKWFLFMEGGGVCDRGTFDCYKRSLTSLGSSTFWAQNTTFQGILSSSVLINPSFYDWNTVFIKYCDGACYSGDREDPDQYNGKDLYYRGYRILTAIIEDLNINRNLKQATDVVLSGCSAGGIAVYLHMNYIQTLVPATARFSGIPDAGFILDIPSYNKIVHNSYYVHNMMKLQDIDNALMPECKQNYPADVVWKCLYAPYIYKYIKAPIMVINSRYDSYQIFDFFLLPCTPPNCSEEEMKYFKFFEQSFKEQLSVVTNDTKSTNGYFLDSCLVHCQTRGDDTWLGVKVQGLSISQAVYNWYHKNMEVKIDDCDYPCNPTCTKG